MARVLGKSGESKKQTAATEPMDENEVIRIYQQMQGKTPQQVQEELYRVAMSEINAGTFQPAQLDDFYRAAAPMLTEPQKEQMRSMIYAIKGMA